MTLALRQNSFLDWHAKIVIALLALAQCCSCTLAQTQAGNGAQKKASRIRLIDSGNALAFYPDGWGNGKPIIVHLHKKMEVNARVSVRKEDGTYIYEYDIENLAFSPDTIDGIDIQISSGDRTATALNPAVVMPTGAKWLGTQILKEGHGWPMDLLGGGGAGEVWWASDGHSLSPGQSISLRVKTGYLPGISIIYYDHVPAPSDDTLGLYDDLTAEETEYLMPPYVSRHDLTIGPRYSQQMNKDLIARDILSGLRYAINHKHMKENAWTGYLVRYLSSYSESQPYPFEALDSLATSPFDHDLTAALRIALQRTPQ